MRVRFLIVILMLSIPVQASYTPFTGIVWKINQAPYQSVMTLQIDKAISVAFIKVAGEKMKLRLSSPYLVNNTVTAALYQIHSPLQQPVEKQLTDEIYMPESGSASAQNELIFTNKINRLLANMGVGDWALVELHLNDGRVQQINIPAISFNEKLQVFYASINTLPPISWQKAKHFTVHFSLSEAGLSQQEKSNLSNLVSVIKYDRGVKKITIDGYTDQSGNRLNNLTLSKRRVQSVKNHLIKLGINPSLIKASRHHGQRYPVKGGKPEENRRVEIQLFKTS